uniref:Uncharacterized protein LOC105126151 n=1 Tax=Rhizophora mucronata TaxID=61149 RepID=A0A2P2MYL7_RHIMU
MNSTTLATTTSCFHFKTQSPSFSLSHFNSIPIKPHNTTSSSSYMPSLVAVKASSSHTSMDTNNTTTNDVNSILPKIKSLTKSAVLIAATASVAAKFPLLPAKAQMTIPIVEEERQKEGENIQSSTPLAKLLESNAEAVESLKSVLQQKLENGEDEEALKILEQLVAAQSPSANEWKFLMARLLNEMDRTQDARKVFEEILVTNPLCFEALFENAILMDRCGEGDAVIARLQEALDIAEEENKAKEARDVRLIMAQIQFLQKKVDEALKSYQELCKEDPNDFRPYFCQGMIYSLLDRNEEAREQFAKYRELSPKKFEVEGYLRSPLSKRKIFGSNEDK